MAKRYEVLIHDGYQWQIDLVLTQPGCVKKKSENLERLAQDRRAQLEIEGYAVKIMCDGRTIVNQPTPNPCFDDHHFIDG